MTDNATSTIEMINTYVPLMQLIVMIVIAFFMAIIAGNMSKKHKNEVISKDKIEKRVEVANGLKNEIDNLFQKADIERQKINVSKIHTPPLPPAKTISEPKQQQETKSMINDILKGLKK